MSILPMMVINHRSKITQTKGEGKRLPTLCSNQEMKSIANNLSFYQTIIAKQH